MWAVYQRSAFVKTCSRKASLGFAAAGQLTEMEPEIRKKGAPAEFANQLVRRRAVDGAYIPLLIHRNRNRRDNKDIHPVIQGVLHRDLPERIVRDGV